MTEFPKADPAIDEALLDYIARRKDAFPNSDVWAAKPTEVTMDAAPAKKPRIYTMPVARVYPEYIAKAERKGRTKAEVDEVIRWLTGYSQPELDARLADQTDLETFYAEAPAMNPARTQVKGVICGVRVEDIQDPTMQAIRYLDKLVDELAKGRPMEKILRS